MSKVKYSLFFVKICFGNKDKKLPFQSWNIIMQEKDNGISLLTRNTIDKIWIIMKNNNPLQKKQDLMKLRRTLQVHQQSKIRKITFFTVLTPLWYFWYGINRSFVKTTTSKFKISNTDSKLDNCNKREEDSYLYHLL